MSVLTPISRVYSLVSRLNLRFRSHNAARPARPVVSVGNISMGGTGKTPVCMFLAECLAGSGRRPVVLTRGYKAKPGRLPHLVSTDDDPAICGDEPLLLARSLEGRADIVVDPRRSRAAEWSLEKLDPDVFVLDDGFQHVQVKRDKDLVLLTPSDLEDGWNRVFPAGRWREDKGALDRADIFLINLRGRDIEEVEHLAAGRPELKKRPVIYFDVQAEELKNIDPGSSVWSIDSRPYLLVTGVADPQKVYATASGFLGYPPQGHLPFPDHHAYGRESVRSMVSLAKTVEVADVICTSKDAVKLDPIPGLNVWEIKTKVRIIGHSENEFLGRVLPSIDIPY